MKLILVVGTDGAGKTTLAKRLAREEIGGRGMQYVYCQLTPLLLAPMKLVARLFYLRKTDAFEDYSEYQRRKTHVSSKRRLLTRIYCVTWLVDQALQSWVRLLRVRLSTRVVIVDRYYIDAVVNTGVLLQNSAADMIRLANLIERFLPRPDAIIFLDVSEEVAYSRKSDIPSREYLRERKERYLQLSPAYDFKVLDADQPFERVLEEARCVIRDTFPALPGSSSQTVP